MFRATTQGTPASWPLRCHRSLVDHAHKASKRKSYYSKIAWRCSQGVRRCPLPDCLAGDTYHQAQMRLWCPCLQLSPGGTLLTVRRHVFQYPLVLKLPPSGSKPSVRRYISTTSYTGYPLIAWFFPSSCKCYNRISTSIPITIPYTHVLLSYKCKGIPNSNHVISAICHKVIPFQGL